LFAVINHITPFEIEPKLLYNSIQLIAHLVKIKLFMKKTLFLLFALTSSILPQNFLEYNDLDKRINELTFNEEYDSALNLCDSIIKIDKLNPKYYFYYFGADALKLHSKLNQSPLNDRDSLKESLLKKSINKMEHVLENLEDIEETPTNRFYKAGLYGYYSRHAGMNGSWWAAYKNGMRSVDMFEEIIEEYPECYDAYLYPGVFKYYADRLSGITGFLAGILGVSGDRSEGLREINLALKNGKIVFPQASLMMLEIYAFMEGDGYASLTYFEAFIDQFPKNQKIKNWYVNTMLNLGLAEKASIMFEDENTKMLDDFVKAKYYFLINDNPASIEFARSAFEDNPPTWRGIIEYTKYLYIYNNWLMGDEEEVNKRKSQLSEYYNKKFNLDSAYASESKYVYKLRSLAARGEHEAFYQLIEKAPDFKGKEFEDEFYLIQGVFLYQQERFAEAEPYFIKSKKSNNWRSKVNSLGYLLDIYLATDTTEEKAEELFKEIGDSDYKRLIFRSADLEKKYRL